MWKNYLLYGILPILMLFAACRDEEKDIEIREVVNWYAIQDKPGELGHLLYQIYQKTGVSIFVNDTLGCVDGGLDADGNPVYNYETVSLKYYIYGANDDIRRILSKDTVVMLRAARAIEDWVVPNLVPSGENRIKSLLLVDSLFCREYGDKNLIPVGKTAWVVNESVETTPVGRLSDMNTMDKRELKFWAGMILSVKASDWINTNCADMLSLFYKITNADAPSMRSFYRGHYGYWVDADTGEYIDDEQHLGKMWPYYQQGFLEWTDIEREIDLKWVEDWGGKDRWIKQILRAVPSKSCDVMHYIAAVYAFSDEEFENMFDHVEGTEKCVKKRLFMKDLVKQFEDAHGVTRHPFE